MSNAVKRHLWGMDGHRWPLRKLTGVLAPWGMVHALSHSTAKAPGRLHRRKATSICGINKVRQLDWKPDCKELIIYHDRASLVAQCLRICLPMQGTRVRSLAREDPTCHGATKPVRHNYWACAPEPTNHNHWAHVPQLLQPTCLQPVLQCSATREATAMRSPCTATKSSPRSPQLEKARVQQQRPNTAKNK